MKCLLKKLLWKKVLPIENNDKELVIQDKNMTNEERLEQLTKIIKEVDKELEENTELNKQLIKKGDN